MLKQKQLKQLEKAGAKLGELAQVAPILLGTCTPIKQAKHIDLFMVAVKEVAAHVFMDLRETVYPVVANSRGDVLMIPPSRLADYPGGKEPWEALSAFQARHSLLGLQVIVSDTLQVDGIANYLWLMLGVWAVEPEGKKLATLEPVDYAPLAYPTYPSDKNKKSKQSSQSVDANSLAVLEKRAYRAQLELMVAYFGDGVGKTLAALPKKELKQTLAYLARPQPEGAARKDKHEHYRWLALYQCAGKTAKEIEGTLELDEKGTDYKTIEKALRDTARQCGLALRKGLSGPEKTLRIK